MKAKECIFPIYAFKRPGLHKVTTILKMLANVPLGDIIPVSSPIYHYSRSLVFQTIPRNILKLDFDVMCWEKHMFDSSSRCLLSLGGAREFNVNKKFSLNQCCGSGSARIRSF